MKRKGYIFARFVLFSFLGVFFLCSCASSKNLAKNSPESVKHAEIINLPENKGLQKNNVHFFENGTKSSDLNYKAVPGQKGVYLFDFYDGKQKVCSVVRINFDECDLEPSVWIGKPDSKGKWIPSYVKTAAKKKGAKIAINATPFYFNFKWNIYSKTWPAGLVYFDGKYISKPVNGYCAAVFFENDFGFSCKIIESQSEFEKIICESDKEKICCALGGFWVSYKGGKYRKFKHILDYRSVLGTSDDGHIIYLLTMKNADYLVCTKILESLGATSVMHFDGGSSTSLFVEGEGVFPKKFNRPVSVSLLFCKKLKQ